MKKLYWFIVFLIIIIISILLVKSSFAATGSCIEQFVGKGYGKPYGQLCKWLSF